MRTILWLEEMTAEDGDQVGIKALNLAEIERAGLTSESVTKIDQKDLHGERVV